MLDEFLVSFFRVQNEEGDAPLMRCPSDVSGVIGSDGRLYLTNMYRMYVPDVNFLHGARTSIKKPGLSAC